MAKGQVAKASIAVNVPISKVWDALVNPDAIKRYMFGATVVSDWREGSSIIWKGEWQGRPYQDKGVILQLKPNRTLQYTHFSPLSGVPDTPENYHTVAVELSTEGDKTRVVLTQDNNPTEQAREHSERNWTTMLATLKKFLED
ncbi:MAG TPA: SRPBCC domain-containing protein [bacterium]|nr:SRPBCC domain-containing protein [bacterium]